MNENLDLCEILKDVPIGTKFFNSATGCEVTFDGFKEPSSGGYMLYFDGASFTSKGQMTLNPNADCLIFPSKDQRDWSKYVKPEPKKVKVVLHPFDRVLVRDETTDEWSPSLLFYIDEDACNYRYITFISGYDYCIPYNKDTAHLLRTTDPCPIDYEIEFCKDYKEE